MAHDSLSLMLLPERPLSQSIRNTNTGLVGLRFSLVSKLHENLAGIRVWSRDEKTEWQGRVLKQPIVHFLKNSDTLMATPPCHDQPGE